MPNNILETLGQSEADTLHRVINNTFIVEMGIVKDIPSDGIVTVEMSVANDAENIVVTNCVLANFASSSVTVNIKPNIDDKVLVLFPRKFAGGMFNPETNEPIISEAVTGYCMTGGIAILMNQYQEAFHKNFIDVSDGKLTMKLAYSEDDEKNLLVLETNELGEITLQTNEKFLQTINQEGEVTIQTNDNFTETINKDGELDIKCNDTNINVNKSNEIAITTGKAKVNIDSSGNITIDAMGGKLSLKNDKASLFNILNGMLQILNSSLATAGSPASHTVVPQQFSQQSTQLGQLMQ